MTTRVADRPDVRRAIQRAINAGDLRRVVQLHRMIDEWQRLNESQDRARMIQEALKR
jgi:hypothetical protein